MRDIKLEVGTKVFLQNKTDQFLMLKRAHPYPGEKFCSWDIPGGRIKPGETQFEALKREVLEETGLLQIKILAILGVQDILQVQSKHTVRVTYLGKCSNTKTVKIDTKEHSEYKWLSLKEISQTPHDKFLDPIIKILQDQKK